jgi:hypothetical protein
MRTRNTALSMLAGACCISTLTLAQQHSHDGHTTAQASAALHMRMTELTTMHAGDSARVDQLTWAVRRGIARYADVRVATRDGYRPLFVGDTAVGQVLHYTHIWRGIQETRRLDPTQPGSLLYEKQPNGSLRLVGAMFGAPERSTMQQLDARVPLSFARWHLHTNICTPRPVWDATKWAQKLSDGQPAFGPDSPVATEAECTKLSGDFRPSTFGWMVHAMVIDGGPPREVWGGESGHAMSGMTGTSAPVPPAR